MAENSAQERTEEATSKRLADAKKKGQIPRSKELNTLVSLLAGGFCMLVFGRRIIDGIATLLTESLSFGHAEAFSDSIIASYLTSTVNTTFAMLSPLFIILVCTSIISPLSLGGWVFSGSQLAPKMERLNVFKGIAKMFSSKSLVELLKAIAKFLLVGATTVFVIYSVLDQIFALPTKPLDDLLSSTGSLFIWCFLAFSSALIVVAFIDIPFQIWDHSKQMKMTKQEVRDEMKETEGKPEIKSAIRERQQELSRQRMMSEVPTADVVITNPTHYAVALRYDQTGSGAPMVVAKGKDLVAARIRELAKENAIPLFAAPPLARALYASTELNHEIPANLFLAVAQVLAFIFQLKRAKFEKDIVLKRPENIEIPEEYIKGEIE